MGRQSTQMRHLRGILKDKVSLVIAALSFKRTAASVHVAVLHVTTHCATSPPPEHRLAALLALGQGSRRTASLCVAAVVDRLHGTADAFVALKCLLTLHHIAVGGSFILLDQLSFYSSDGRNFLNLSNFRDGRDMETWELSSWIRWYAGVLDANLMSSRVLGTYISSISTIKSDWDKDRLGTTSLLNSDLMRDLGVLVGLVKEISRAPESLHQLQNNLVYEVVNLVGQDYRWTQRHISVRLTEFGERIPELSSGERAELSCLLTRIEDCKERLSELFVNRQKNDEFWELVGQTRAKILELEEKERAKWLAKVSEPTRLGERVLGPSPVLRLTSRGEWPTADGVRLAVRPALDSKVAMVF